MITTGTERTAEAAMLLTMAVRELEVSAHLWDLLARVERDPQIKDRQELKARACRAGAAVIREQIGGE